MSAAAANVQARRKPGLTTRALDGEVLVYDPSTTRASCLNAFAAEVLARCDGGSTAAEIARDLPFGEVDPRVVTLALADLHKAGLVEADAAIAAAALTGPSRREFFRRIGVGTAIAVPVVTGIALPHAAQAASYGQTCYTDGDCAPGLACLQRQTGNPCQNEPHGKDCQCLPMP